MPRHKILVVDDYPDAADIACMLFGLLGHDTRAVHTGQAAIDTAIVFQPDIVVLDIGLPDISGFDVARELRKLFAGRQLHIAAVTGWGQPADRVRAFAAGFDQHILKPSDLPKLQSVLDAADKANHGRSPTHQAADRT